MPIAGREIPARRPSGEKGTPPSTATGSSPWSTSSRATRSTSSERGAEGKIRPRRQTREGDGGSENAVLCHGGRQLDDAADGGANQTGRFREVRGRCLERSVEEEPQLIGGVRFGTQGDTRLGDAVRAEHVHPRTLASGVPRPLAVIDRFQRREHLDELTVLGLVRIAGLPGRARSSRSRASSSGRTSLAGGADEAPAGPGPQERLGGDGSRGVRRGPLTPRSRSSAACCTAWSG